MSLKTKPAKRKARAARRAGACKRCTPIDSDKMLHGGKRNTASAPCAKCGRALPIDLDTFGGWAGERLAAYIRAVSPYEDVCFEKLIAINKGEPYPEQPHGLCDKAHVIIIKDILA